MDSRDLSVHQLDALFDKLRPMAYHVAMVRKRMEQQCFPESDELATLVREAETAMPQLATHVNSLAAHRACQLVLNRSSPRA
jgi:hypothetical protein